MTSLFDRIPYEVLKHIIYYATHDNKKGAFQFQMVSKLWYSVAEEFAYEELDLSKLDESTHTFSYYKSLLGPRRSKFVKTLLIDFITLPSDDDGERVPFDDSFFQVFPNISKVCRCEDDYDEYNWLLYLCENFTSKRCKLKELGELNFPYCARENVAMSKHYFTVVFDHAQSLEKLVIPEVNDSNADIIRLINGQSTLPSMRELTVCMHHCNLQDLDKIVNKCPKLEYISISVGGWTEDQSQRITECLPKVKHQQCMRKVCVGRLQSRMLPAVFSYLTAKFTDVEEWVFDTSDYLSLDLPVGENDTVTYFEDIEDSFVPIVEVSDKATLALQFYCKNTVDTFDFFYNYLWQSSGWKVSISYDNSPYTDYDCEEYGIVPNCYVFSEKYPYKNDDYYDGYDVGADTAAMRVACSNLRNTSLQNTAQIKYISSSLHHMKLLEEVGFCIKTLEVYEVPLDDRDQGEPRNVLSHILDTCNGLTTLDYYTYKYGHNGESIATTPVHNNLKKITIGGSGLPQLQLLNLSVRAPNITDFTIKYKEPYYEFNGEPRPEHEMAINMPHNSFDSLEIQCEVYEDDESLFFHPITVMFVLLESNTKRYYVQASLDGYASQRECDNEEEYLKFYRFPGSTNITVTCKSIRHFEYCSSNGAFCFDLILL